MRAFITVLVLIFSLQSFTKADDISDFEIEGMSLGESLLDFFSEEEILNGIRKDSYEYTDTPIDLDLGLVAGWRITDNLGVFVEGTYLKYWEKPIYECKFGFNYLIF